MCAPRLKKPPVRPKPQQNTRPNRLHHASPAARKLARAKRRHDLILSPELLHIQVMVQTQLKLMAGRIPLTYLVLDGHFGNHPAWHMVQQCGLQLISKLRCDAALYLPYDGPYKGHGPHQKYGDRLDYQHLPAEYLMQTTTAKQIETRIDQMPCLHKEFSQPLNVVILVKVNLQTQAWAHVILFSSDLAFTYDTLIDYYRLRFQIEFNFRDAKQYWGLEDFMNVAETAVTNAANLSLFMVNVSQRLLGDLRPANPDGSVLDLKALCRGAKYVAEAIKMLPEKPEPVVLARIFKQLTALGRIHVAQTHVQLAIVGEGVVWITN